MKTVLIETPIPAPPELVWDVLIDFPRYGEWNPFITSIEGELEVGEEVPRQELELVSVAPMLELAVAGRLGRDVTLGGLGSLAHAPVTQQRSR